MLPDFLKVKARLETMLKYEMELLVYRIWECLLMYRHQ